MLSKRREAVMHDGEISRRGLMKTGFVSSPSFLMTPSIG